LFGPELSRFTPAATFAAMKPLFIALLLSATPALAKRPRPPRLAQP